MAFFIGAPLRELLTMRDAKRNREGRGAHNRPMRKSETTGNSGFAWRFKLIDCPGYEIAPASSPYDH
jgi:hypothetical protein